MITLLYLLFFLSGISGLIYQVVWVRVFGNVFGNTIYSAAIVVAIFMLGLGAGSYVVGAWADRRYARRPDSLLRAYGVVEIAIAALGLAIAALLPQLDRVSALVSSYVEDPRGWHVLSTGSYLARAGIAVTLVAPITLLMGGTLTLLIRHLVRSNVAIGGWRVAVLYAINTAGAAAGAVLTDFALVPSYGLRNTQFIAVALNVVAGAGAMLIARSVGADLKVGPRVRAKSRIANRESRMADEDSRFAIHDSRLVWGTAAALALSGFAAMGMEILWFRHFTIILGQFRAVFSLLLAVILVGIGIGSLAAGALSRRTPRPAAWFMFVQALFVAASLFGLSLADASVIDATISSDPNFVAGAAGTAGTIAELWFNARPILIEVALPALLMGFSFPLANAIVQRAEYAVGRRAGVLYFANTAGAVAGSLVAGFVLLPGLGIQQSASVLMVVAAAPIVALYMARADLKVGPYESSNRVGADLQVGPAAGCLLLAAASLAVWFALPRDFIIARALPDRQEGVQLLTLQEGVNEVISITEQSGLGRTLYTNGHPMSSTLPLAQRYMRALAHIPLLSMPEPRDVLVIGFGVGNTTHAASLHPDVRRVDVADLSRDILDHASYFRDFNKDVLADARVAVYLNDGRQHLQMQPPASYDLVTLEPPPIGYAGVAALYSREFYELARARLRPGGYMSQWLPAYQVPTATTLAMVRAFVDVFPGAVLLSGAESDLLLIGANGRRAEVDPGQLAARLARAPAVAADMRRISLGTPTEIVGSFIGSAQTLADATRETPPVTDDRPVQEYGVLSLLNFGEAVPTSMVNLDDIDAWCPRCFAGGRPTGAVGGLDLYMALLRRAYSASPDEIRAARLLATREGRQVIGSRYLGAIVPESADLHNTLGIWLAGSGAIDQAEAEFRRALELEPRLAATYWHLGAALAAQGKTAEAAQHLRRSVEIDPTNAEAQNDLQTVLRTLPGGRSN